MPVEGEEEALRKAKIRRWMVGCKVADYEIAVLYLKQAGFDLADAMKMYFADVAWEREHPLGGKCGAGWRSMGKGQVILGVGAHRVSNTATLRKS
jgi:hypothetical protein